MSEKKEAKESKSGEKKQIALDGGDRLYEKMILVARAAGTEPPTPQPENKKGEEKKQKG